MGKVYLDSQLYRFQIVMDHTILLALLIKMLDCYGSKLSVLASFLPHARKEGRWGLGLHFIIPCRITHPTIRGHLV